MGSSRTKFEDSCLLSGGSFGGGGGIKRQDMSQDVCNSDVASVTISSCNPLFSNPLHSIEYGEGQLDSKFDFKSTWII